jgi:hypothetical protein
MSKILEVGAEMFGVTDGKTALLLGGIRDSERQELIKRGSVLWENLC